jgi:hypothetical protein
MNSEFIDEFFGCDASLLKNPTQRSHGEFCVQWNDTTGNSILPIPL